MITVNDLFSTVVQDESKKSPKGECNKKVGVRESDSLLLTFKTVVIIGYFII